MQTAPWRMAGTPLYVAPERLRDPSRNDPRVDLYAVGAVAFKLLTGESTFAGTEPGELMARVLESTPPRVRAVAPHVPSGLDALVAELLDRDPDRRPARCEDVAARLEQLRARGEVPEWTRAEAEEWWARRTRVGRSTPPQ